MDINWLISENNQDNYYENEFLVCPGCCSTIHIVNIDTKDEIKIKYHCKCGRFNKNLQELLKETTFYLQKNSLKEEKPIFNNKLRTSPITLNVSIPKCKNHRDNSVSFCHDCTQYLCNHCLITHKNHLCYSEKLKGKNRQSHF